LDPLANPSESDSALLARVRLALDGEALSLDAATLARLRAARRSALARAGRRRTWRVWPTRSSEWLLPASGFASIAVVALTIAVTVGRPGVAPRAGVEDVELLGSKADLELLDDLDFYAWLPSAEGRG